MNGQRGKITFLGLIVFVILVLVGFMAFKYIATGLEKKQIKIEVYDTLGTVRSGDISNSQSMEVIESVLQKKKIEILDIATDVDSSKGNIRYSFKYKIETDYLLFKHSEIVEVVSEIASYGI